MTNELDFVSIGLMDKKALEQLGFDEWFQDKSQPYIKDGYSIVRIVEVNRNSYKVCGGQHNTTAELSGKYLYDIKNSIGYPTVGDWVAMQCFNDKSTAIIHGIVPRKSLLKRKDPGRAVGFQLIAANKRCRCNTHRAQYGSRWKTPM